jgi:plastocyanin
VSRRIFGLLALGSLLGLAMIVPVEAVQPTHKPGGFHSPEIQRGGSWTHRFNETGTAFYHCHPHPFMQGNVEVQAGVSNDPVTIEVSGFKFVPEHVVVGVGTNVTWTNRDASFHTVDESLVPDGATDPGGKSPANGFLLIAMSLLAVAVCFAPKRRR